MRYQRCRIRFRNPMMAAIVITMLLLSGQGFDVSAMERSEEPLRLFHQFCIDCHQGKEPDGNFDLLNSLDKKPEVLGVIFENIATGKMPPVDQAGPSVDEKKTMLEWLAARQETAPSADFRRISRREFMHSVNDLLGTSFDLASEIPDDRGTYTFDRDRRIQLGAEVLRSYFATADAMLEMAFPAAGIRPPKSWVTKKLKDSHDSYRIYVRDYQEGLLLSWTRANNGNSYSFFFDDFDPPEAGWYDLTFDAAKVGAFPDDIALQVHAGRYYYADDRPQPQRLLGVISVRDEGTKPFTLRVFLYPGESVSVHCYCKHTWRRASPTEGAYIRQLKVNGPVQDQWPPRQYVKVFGDRVRGKEGAIVVDCHSSEDLKTVIRNFAERAFSTQLSGEELSPYVNVACRVFAEDGNFIRAAKVGFKAVVCSPRFLMVPGEHSSEAEYWVAHLARTLWLSIPDDRLRQTALHVGEHGMSREILRQQIHRMLADERSERMIESFCDQWLNLRAWNKVAPSLKLYPHYDDLLHHYLPLETRKYLAYLIRENMPVSHLIDSDYSFLNQRLAEHYGIAGVTGLELRKIKFGPEVPRGGLLTMGSVLKVTTDGFQTSPILRGAWIAKNIAGIPVSPPPSPVEAIEPEHGSSAQTLREQIDQHKTNAACYACHNRIDPYGFALESFDASGQWRDNYRVELPHSGTFQFRLEGYFRDGSDVDSSGEVDGVVFEDIFGLKELLIADLESVAYNFAKKFFEFANGYAPNLTQRMALLQMVENGPTSGSIRDLVTEVLVYSLTEEA